MTSQRKSFALLAVGVSALVLGGCSINHPNAMPSGYTHHKEGYKSPSSPPSYKVSAEQRKYMDGTQAEQFRDGVYDLLKRVTSRAGMPPKPVYVLTPSPMTTFYANIDNDLREGMRHIGYALSDIPTNSYVFAYDARYLDQPRGATIGGEQANVELILRVFDSIGADARMLTEETGYYYIQGAETLNIRPANYKQDLLPSREKIMKQAAGFDERRTASEVMDQTPMSSSNYVSGYVPGYASGSAGSFQTATPPAVISTPSNAVAPSAPPVESSPYGGPSQAVMIDSNGTSYDDGMTYQGATTDTNVDSGFEPYQSDRPRVSQEVEY